MLEAIARPVAAANRAIAELKEFASLREENARLREENARLLAWQTAARRLENENERMRGLPISAKGRRLLHYRAHRGRQRQRLCARRAAQCRPPGRRASGQAVVTGEGLAGRIAEVGDNSARVLL